MTSHAQHKWNNVYIQCTCICTYITLLVQSCVTCQYKLTYMYVRLYNQLPKNLDTNTQHTHLTLYVQYAVRVQVNFMILAQILITVDNLPLFL